MQLRNGLNAGVCTEDLCRCSASPGDGTDSSKVFACQRNDGVNRSERQKATLQYEKGALKPFQ